MKLFTNSQENRFLLLRPHHLRRIGHDPQNEGTVPEALDTVEKMFRDRPGWVIGGGIAIVYQCPGFSRTHHDIDILIDEDHFASFVARAKEHQYQLVRQRGSAWLLIGGHWQILESLDVKESKNCGFSRVYLLCRNPSRDINPLLRLIDITIYRRTGGAVVRSDGKVSVAETDFGGSLITTKSGGSIPLVGLQYLRKTKLRRNKLVDRKDLRVIEDQSPER